MKTSTTYKLRAIAEIYHIVPHVIPMLQNDSFGQWSGSGNPKHHHYGDGGLARHTLEVVQFCDAIACQHDTNCGKHTVNIKSLLISAYWHDYGKLWDYQKVDNVWGKHNDHCRNIGHISKSAIEFGKFFESLPAIVKYGIDDQKVIHNILSHHGNREWGSPVSPSTQEAWILHLADMLSARLDDHKTYDKF